MADTGNFIQISNDLGLTALGTLVATVAGTTWWFSSQLKKITDSQARMKEEQTLAQTQLTANLTANLHAVKADLTKSISDVDTSQAKRDHELDRGVSAVQAALSSHSSLIEQKMNTLQSQMADVASQIKENRHDTNELRERVVRLETIAEKMGAPPERA